MPHILRRGTASSSVQSKWCLQRGCQRNWVTVIFSHVSFYLFLTFYLSNTNLFILYFLFAVRNYSLCPSISAAVAKRRPCSTPWSAAWPSQWPRRRSSETWGPPSALRTERRCLQIAQNEKIQALHSSHLWWFDELWQSSTHWYTITAVTSEHKVGVTLFISNK